MKQQLAEIQQFCRDNANPANVEKYARYFVDGYDAHGVDSKLLEKQRNAWLNEWNNTISWDQWLKLADLLLDSPKYEERMSGIGLIMHQRERFTPDLFGRVEAWYANGWIRTWADVDVSATQILQPLILDGHAILDQFRSWLTADSIWQRRAVPVSCIGLLGGQMINAGGISKGKPIPESAVPVYDLLEFVRPILWDDHKKVQQGVGWFLRTAWQRFPAETEPWLIANRDLIAPFSMGTATEKMDKEKKALVKGPKRRKSMK
jgi:3-methyladenine DNA glycosylase AlkD